MSFSPFIPLAQTFFVDSTATPDGVTLAAIDVCFSYKDDTLPITLSLCPTNNGFPDPTRVYADSSVTLYPEDVKTTTGTSNNAPSFSDLTTYTRFRFPSPIQLPPGQHAFIFNTGSFRYVTYIAKMQDYTFGTNRLISRQPYQGVLYKGQNTGAWTEILDKDLMFRIVRSKFVPRTVTTVTHRVVCCHQGNTEFHLVFFASDTDTPGRSEVSHSFQYTDNTTRTLVSTADELQTHTDIAVGSVGTILGNSNSSFYVTTRMTCDSEYVSPRIATPTLSVTTIHYKINNGELSNDIISVAQGGTGYTSTPTVAITAPTRSDGVQAGAVATVVNGRVTGLTITATGSGYITTPSVSFSGGGGSGAMANVSGETSTHGGTAKTRYITRKVQLANGFDATDLQIYLTANKRVPNDIQVYYKALSAEDPDQSLENKNWVIMGLQNNQTSVYSTNEHELIEYKYVTTTGNARYTTSDGTIYDSFRTFQIKVCMFTSDQIVIPMVKDFRGVALA